MAGSTRIQAHWAPSGYDIAGARRSPWLAGLGLIAALLLLAGFYGVVDGAVQRADQVHREATGISAAVHGAVAQASL